jgi:hypothetical protein
MQREGKLTPAKARAVRFVLASRDATDMLEDDIRGMLAYHADEIETDVSDDPGAAVIGASGDDSDLAEFPLLRWLWENRETILAFILKIVGLFRGL